MINISFIDLPISGKSDKSKKIKLNFIILFSLRIINFSFKSKENNIPQYPLM